MNQITESFAKLSIVFLSLVLFISCGINGVNGNGNVVQKTRKISSDFVKVKVNSGIDLFLTEDSNIALVVEADENLLELITTEVKDGVLHISTSKNIGIAKSKKVYLTTSHLNEIESTSGADIISENTINAKDLKLTATSGSDMKLRINADNIWSECTSGADINLKGRAKKLKAIATSGSDINAYEFEVKICEAEANSGADIKVNVLEKISAKASSGGDVKYRGNPEIIQIDESSSGDVKKV